MNTVVQLIAARRKDGHEIWLAGGASEDQVAALERALGLSLPPTYSNFLKMFGALSLDDHHVSGIVGNNAVKEQGGNVLWDTSRFRKEKEFPAGLIVIGKHEDGAYCLDSSRGSADQEFPVVNFEYGSIQHEKPVARNFLEWLIRFRLYGEQGVASPNNSLERTRER
jgi:hypothetical protein